jgi:phage shock protein C
MDVTTRCRNCSGELSAEAAKCPLCGKRAVTMHRGEGRVVAGVCSALSRELDVDTALVRVAFVLLFFASGGAALAAYLLIWGFTPARAWGKAPLKGPLDWVSRTLRTPEDDEPRWERRV